MKKRFKAVELNCLSDDVAMKIREWRNQDFVKMMSLSQHDITEYEHASFIEMVKKDGNRGLFVFFLDEVPFGVFHYRFLPELDAAYISDYLVSEEYQYMGYGVILAYFLGVITFEVLSFNNSVGDVLAKNTRAISMAKKIGGSEMDDSNDIIIKTKTSSRDWFEKQKEKYKRVVFEVVSEQYEIICDEQ